MILKIKKEEEKTKEIDENKIENKVEILCEKKIEYKESKYAKFLSINKFRNKPNSIINLMMINGFQKKKVFEINLN